MELNSKMQVALQETQTDPKGTVQRIIDSDPALTVYGYDDTSDPVLINQGRQELLEAANTQLAISSEWFSRQHPLEGPVGGIYTHILKYEVAKFATSKLGHSINIQEGILIAAALQMGFPVDGTCGGSALIGVKRTTNTHP